jgi:hypothetical protein
MKGAKPIGSAEVQQSSETEARGNIHELTRPNGGSAKAEHNNDETWADSLETLLRRVSEVSAHEIGSLIEEFDGLRKKLETDLSRIQRDIAEYAELTQGVTQLAILISDNMKNLPRPSAANR